MPEDGHAVYMLSGGGERSDWVQNLVAHPSVTVRIGTRGAPENRAIARVVTDPEEDAGARRLLLDKYAPGYGGDLSGWGRSALPIALEPA